MKDHDTRFQVNDNLSVIRGAHSFKFAAEINRTSTTQMFLGFANGRYIFDSVQGFMNYVNIGPKFVECSDGSTNNNGVCPKGTTITGPLLLFLQFAGVIWHPEFVAFRPHSPNAELTGYSPPASGRRWSCRVVPRQPFLVWRNAKVQAQSCQLPNGRFGRRRSLTALGRGLPHFARLYINSPRRMV